MFKDSKEVIRQLCAQLGIFNRLDIARLREYENIGDDADYIEYLIDCIEQGVNVHILLRREGGNYGSQEARTFGERPAENDRYL